jgi:iron complex outermembrane receptor protein
MKRSRLLFLVLWALSCRAQQSPTPPVSETVVVVGSPEPVTLGESPRSVVVIDTEQHPLAFSTVEDYLRTDPSTFIEQRGAGGAQADISIRGSSFEQTLILLNGLRLNDAETSHNNLDLPVPLEAMRSIEVLHGAGSTLYGSDALGGVVDFLTAIPATNSLRLLAGGGSFGENEESLLGSLVGHSASEMVTGARTASSGFLPDRDYRNQTGSSETRWQSPLGLTDALFAGSDRAFGANQFYGPYNSWERTKGWFASGRQEIGQSTEAVVGYRRHTDNFVLFRNNPSFYANNHIDQSWQAVVRRKQRPGAGSTLFYGLEANTDSIASNNLGRHARNRGAGYVDVDLHATKRWSLSAGLRAEILSGGARQVWSPDLAGSLWLSRSLKLRASGGYGFRLPTYLDLYYSDPTTVGNPKLKPESAWSGDAGADWYANTRITASLTLFYSRQHDAIDYVRANPADLWHATNLAGFRYTGVEGSLQWLPTRRQTIRLGWTGISGAQSALHGLDSEYVFNYPVNNGNLEWLGDVRGQWLLRTSLQVAQRYHRDAYPVWDLQIARERGWLRPFVRMANVSNTGYQEIANVPMPGRSFVGGVQIVVENVKK